MCASAFSDGDTLCTPLEDHPSDGHLESFALKGFAAIRKDAGFSYKSCLRKGWGVDLCWARSKPVRVVWLQDQHDHGLRPPAFWGASRAWSFLTHYPSLLWGSACHYATVVYNGAIKALFDSVTNLLHESPVGLAGFNPFFLQGTICTYDPVGPWDFNFS